MDALGSELGAGCLTSELELSLFTVVGPLGTGGRAFVTRCAGDSYRNIIIWRGEDVQDFMYP